MNSTADSRMAAERKKADSQIAQIDADLGCLNLRKSERFVDEEGLCGCAAARWSVLLLGTADPALPSGQFRNAEGKNWRNEICVSILDSVSILMKFPGFFVRRSKTEVSTLPAGIERLKHFPRVFLRCSCKCGDSSRIDHG